jgi:hypothetical protein
MGVERGLFDDDLSVKLPHSVVELPHSDRAGTFRINRVKIALKPRESRVKIGLIQRE